MSGAKNPRAHVILVENGFLVEEITPGGPKDVDVTRNFVFPDKSALYAYLDGWMAAERPENDE